MSCRLLFVSVLNESVASHRLRVVKLIPRLRSVGLNADILRYDSRLATLVIPRLLADLIRYRNVPRIVVFQKTIAFTLASLCRRLGARLVMDWDDGGMQRIDGTFYPDTVERRYESWVRLMDAMVVSCNAMRSWICRWNDRVYVIPTCVEVESYNRLPGTRGDVCKIGWVGSRSEVLLPAIEPALIEVSREAEYEMFIVGTKDPQLDPKIFYRFIKWRLDLEPLVFGQFDIGINPLPDNERARLKAGSKLLQYMAAGLPVVASPIGVNREIVKHGKNGFLARTMEEWQYYLTCLISNSDLRLKMGKEGQQYVRECFRLEIAASLWKYVCENLVDLSESVH